MQCLQKCCLLLVLATVSFALEPIADVTDPHSGVTFTLYEALSPWPVAYNACVSFGQRLAIINNGSQQEAVSGFTRTGHAWIAGRWSPDDTWRWISGDSLDDEGHPVGVGIGRCGTTSRIGPFLNPNLCVQNAGSDMPAACQAYEEGVASKRYWITEAFLASWMAARMSCLDQGGDLAHPSHGEGFQDWESQIRILLNGSHSTLWVGVSRHAWSWFTGPDASDYHPMRYSHFSLGEGGGAEEDCVHLDIGSGAASLWFDKGCMFVSRYFICDDGKEVATTTTTSRPRPTSGHTSTVSGISMAMTPTAGQVMSDDPSGLSLTMRYVIGAVTAGVASILIVVIACIVTRKGRCAEDKRRKQDKDSNEDKYEEITHVDSVPDALHIYPYSSSSSVAQRSVTQVVMKNADVSQTPGKAGTIDMTSSSVEQHVAGPHGDMYAVPSTIRGKKR